MHLRINETANTWNKLRALDAREWSILLQAALLLPAVSLALRTRGLVACLDWIERTPLRTGTTRAPVDVARIAGLVGAVAQRSIAPVTCLARSLVLARILRCHGVAANLRIGVRMADGLLDAHAWLERDGVALNDAPDIDAKFAAFREPIGAERSAVTRAPRGDTGAVTERAA